MVKPATTGDGNLVKCLVCGAEFEEGGGVMGLEGAWGLKEGGLTQRSQKTAASRWTSG